MEKNNTQAFQLVIGKQSDIFCISTRATFNFCMSFNTNSPPKSQSKITKNEHIIEHSTSTSVHKHSINRMFTHLFTIWLYEFLQ